MRVGQLERFDDDLLQILADAGVSRAAAHDILRRYAAQVPTQVHLASRSAVARQAQALMRAAFAVDDATRRTLCYLLVPDFLCVNALLPAARRYPLPRGCNETLERIERALAVVDPAGEARDREWRERGKQMNVREMVLFGEPYGMPA